MRINEFGAWAKSERKYAGVTNCELADKSGYCEAYIIGILSGKRYPSLECIENVAQALGYRMDISFIKEN